MNQRSRQETQCAQLKSQNGPMTRLRKNDGLKQSCTAKQAQSEGDSKCSNPLCHNRVEPNRKGDRLYCSDDPTRRPGECRQLTSIIRRSAEKLVPLGKEEAWQILKSQLEAKKTDYKKRSRRNQAT